MIAARLLYDITLSGKFMLLFICVIFFFPEVKAQQPEKTQESVISLEKYLKIIEKEENMEFYYHKEWLDTIYLSRSSAGKDRIEIFRIIDRYGFDTIAYSDWQFILVWKETNPVYSEYNEKGEFKREVHVKGNVRSMDTEETLMGATVQIEELDTGTVTDYDGNYSIKIPSGAYHIRANSIGQEEELFRVSLTRDTTLNFELAEDVITLNEVIISDESIDQNISEVTSGKTQLDMLTIRKLPAFMGETDVIRSLLMMPGVSSTGDGASGFHVRGGTVDQNLVMIDHTPVFNSSHLFGLFSIFNQDIIKNVTLFKGGIPARYGGRLSSVLDVRTKDNITDTFSGQGGIGLISNRLSLDIPLIKDKMSIAVSGRGAFNDFLLHLIPDNRISNSSAIFYDINVKYNYILDKNNILRISYYRGFDQFSLPTDTSYYWGTDNVSIQWNHLFGKGLVGNFTGAYSKFRYGVESEAEKGGYEWRAGIEFRNLKADFNWLNFERHQVGFGASVIQYIFNSGDLIPYSNSVLNPVNMQDEHALESGIYIEDELRISDEVSLMGGIRYSYYEALGPSHVNIYEENQPLKTSTLIDTRPYTAGEKITSYMNWEPRLNLVFRLLHNSSIKISYNRMIQYIHLISNTSSITPTDLWQPSNLYLRPEKSHQFSAGYFRNFLENTIETSLEAFYKDIDDLVDYKDGARLLLNEYIEQELLQGKGRAYGVELLLRKKIGNLTGWFAYTWSRSERKMDSPFSEETINSGKYYPSVYDHPHDLSMTATLQITRRWSLSSTFVYMTGRPGTFPESKYEVDHFTVAGFGPRNMNRIPDYHRLDLSITLDGNLKKNKKWDGSWTFSIYNVYNRNNAYSVFFRSDHGSIPKAYKLSVLGSIFPALTYNFSFNAK